MPLTLLTCVFGPFYYLTIYCLSITCIIVAIYLSEKFPKSVGAWYLEFLKRHSSQEAFVQYCGNLFGALKAVVSHPDFLKVVAKNGAGKWLSVQAPLLLLSTSLIKLKQVKYLITWLIGR